MMKFYFTKDRFDNGKIENENRKMLKKSIIIMEKIISFIDNIFIYII